MTSAIDSSGATATLCGGLAQLPAQSLRQSPSAATQESMIVTVSGAGLRTTVLTPSTFRTLLSLEETASCAWTSDGKPMRQE